MTKWTHADEQSLLPSLTLASTLNAACGGVSTPTQREAVALSSLCSGMVLPKRAVVPDNYYSGWDGK